MIIYNKGIDPYPDCPAIADALHADGSDSEEEDGGIDGSKILAQTCLPCKIRMWP